MAETRYHDEYVGNELVSSTPYIVSDEQLEREQAPAKLKAALRQLNQIANQAEALSEQGTNVTQAQIKQLAGAVGFEARVLRALLIREFTEPTT